MRADPHYFSPNLVAQRFRPSIRNKTALLEHLLALLLFQWVACGFHPPEVSFDSSQKESDEVNSKCFITSKRLLIQCKIHYVL